MTSANRHSTANGPPKGPPIDWSAVVAEHGRWLRTVVLARLGESQAVDEVLQEVFAAAVRQQAPLADRAKIAPWLYRLAVRQTLLYRRKQGRQRKRIARFAERFQPTVHDSRERDPLEWLLTEERRRMVRTALRKLSRGDGEILLLKYTEDWSYHEIAKRLGVSHSAVETRLHRARARLRAELSSAAEFDESAIAERSIKTERMSSQ